MATQAITVRSNVSAGSWAPLSGNPSDFVSSVLSTADLQTTSIEVDDSSTDGDGTFISYFRLDSSALPADASCTQLNFSAAYLMKASAEAAGARVDVGWALKNEANVLIIPGTSLANVVSPSADASATMSAFTPLAAVTKANLNLYQVGIYGKLMNSDLSGNLIAYVNSLSLIVTYTSGAGNIRRSSIMKFWRN